MTRNHRNTPCDRYEIALYVKEDALFYLQIQKANTLVSICSRQNKFNMFPAKMNSRKSMTKYVLFNLDYAN